MSETTQARREKEMTEKKIRERQAKQNVPYEVAVKIRALLNEARKEYGSGWDDDDVECTISELVFDPE